MKANACYFINDANKNLHYVKQAKDNKRKHILILLSTIPATSHQPHRADLRIE